MGKKKPIVVTPTKMKLKERKEKVQEFRGEYTQPGALNLSTEDPLYFTLRVRLLVPDEEKKFIESLLVKGAKLQNYLIKKVGGIIEEMENSKEYTSLLHEQSELLNKTKRTKEEKAKGVTKTPLTAEEKQRLRDINLEIKQIHRDKGLTSFGIYKMVTSEALAGEYECDLGSDTKRYVADKVVTAVTKYLYDKGRFIREKDESEVSSIGWQKGSTRYDIVDQCLVVSCNPKSDKHYLKLDVERNDYAKQCLAQDITCLEITRKGVGKKTRYFANIGIKGHVPHKYGENGELKYKVADSGKVGVQFDKMGCLACTGTTLYMMDLGVASNDSKLIEKEIRLQREMDELRRRDNPQNYNEDGTSKKASEVGELTWYESPEYVTVHSRFNRLSEKRVNIRKRAHWETANKLLGLGRDFFIDSTKFSYKMRVHPYLVSLSEAEEKKFVRDLAPANARLSLLWKLRQNGIEENVWDGKGDSLVYYNHETGDMNRNYSKMGYIIIDGKTVYHGAYLAFLLSHIDVRKERIESTDKNGNTKIKVVKHYTVDRDGCTKDFPEFYKSYEDVLGWQLDFDTNEVNKNDGTK